MKVHRRACTQCPSRLGEESMREMARAVRVGVVPLRLAVFPCPGRPEAICRGIYVVMSAARLLGKVRRYRRRMLIEARHRRRGALALRAMRSPYALHAWFGRD